MKFPLHTPALENLRLAGSWATIGVYDGVHRGHAVLLRRLVAGAHAAGLPAVVVTFHPHPAVVLGGAQDFRLLTLPEERASLLHDLGVDAVVTLPFTRQLANTSAADFMQRLQRHLGLRHLLIGYDFALGRDRSGDYARLAELGRQLGYQVEQVAAVRDEDRIFSSTAARAALQRGQVEQAAEILGRPYSLGGEVIHGDGRGRKINVPTANLRPAPEKLIPARGVYACHAWVGETRWPAVVNIGLRPTFYDDQPQISLEAHLLDFQGDLYGQRVRLDFIARLRPEKRFSGVEALQRQIQADIAAAHKRLAPATETNL